MDAAQARAAAEADRDTAIGQARAKATTQVAAAEADRDAARTRSLAFDAVSVEFARLEAA